MRSRVRPEELLLCAYALTLAVLMTVVHDWHFSTLFHYRFFWAFVLLALAVLAREYRRLRPSEPRPVALRAAARPALRVIRDFFPFLLALIFYERLHDLTPLIRPTVVDATLIAIDRAVFHVDVPVWLGQFATPLLTHVMVFCYLSYFFSPALLACLMYWRGDRQLFRDFLVSLTIVTLLGFIGYLLVPAVGPYLFQAELFPTRLPGGGGISSIDIDMIGTIDNFKGFGRDCFPSLHTAHTTVVLAFTWRYSRRVFAAYLPLALGLYVSTLYLRMHYVTDLAGGFVAAAIAIWAGPRLERWWFNLDEAGVPRPIALRSKP